MKKLLQISAVIFFLACNNSANDTEGPAKAQADSLMKEVMEGHNAAMAKMTRIEETQKKIQQEIDSISKLPDPAQKNSGTYKVRLDSMLSRLRSANLAMDSWMEGFNMDSSLNNPDERIKYLQSEKIKVFQVKDEMIGDLQEADSLLKKK